MTSQAPIEVRQHGKDRAALQRSLDVAVPCFYDDPLFAWLFYGMSAEKRRDKLWAFLKPGFWCAPVAGGFILDAGDWGATMVVSCPGQRYDSTANSLKSGAVQGTLKCGLRPTIRLLGEYLPSIEKCKATVMKPAQFYDCYYIMFAATAQPRRRQGLLAAMTQRVIEWAQRDGKPIWLEATSEDSVRQFRRQGFEVVGDISPGRGKVNAEGLPEKGGSGLQSKGMIWRPERTWEGLRGEGLRQGEDREEGEEKGETENEGAQPVTGGA